MNFVGIYCITVALHYVQLSSELSHKKDLLLNCKIIAKEMSMNLKIKILNLLILQRFSAALNISIKKCTKEVNPWHKISISM